MGNIARIFSVSTVAVLKWIRCAASSIETLAPQKAEVVMVDEFWHFVNGKKAKFGYEAPLMAYRVSLSNANWAVVLMPPSQNSSKKEIMGLVVL